MEDDDPEKMLHLDSEKSEHVDVEDGANDEDGSSADDPSDMEDARVPEDKSADDAADGADAAINGDEEATSQLAHSKHDDSSPVTASNDDAIDASQSDVEILLSCNCTKKDGVYIG